MPIECELDLEEFKGVILNSLYKIKDIIIEAIHNAPPQIAPDLIEDGATLTGGLALIPGIKDFLEKELRMQIHLTPDPLLDISKGVWQIMQDYESFEKSL